MIRIELQLVADQATLPEPGQLRGWVRATLRGLRDDAQLTLRIVGEAEGRELNEKWRHGSGPTNVLSFPAGDSAELVPGFLGDIVICAPVVLREARQQHKRELDHWAHLVIHGTLHLLGYDHGDERAAERMESLEIRILDRIGIANPYC